MPSANSSISASKKSDATAWATYSSRPQALLLISTDSTADGLNPAYGVAAGDNETMIQFAASLNGLGRSGLMYSLSRGEVARAVSGGLALIENRLRTHAGIGLAPTQAEGKQPAPAPRDTSRPAPVPSSNPAPAPESRATPSVGWGWILGSFAGFGALALLVVAVRSRAKAVQRKCPNCGREMEVASEVRRAKILNEAQLAAERTGGARHVVLACRCGQTQVKSTS
jgi:hypothetical protein